ncbi:hypothetical protein R4Z09_14040 [Niallia oryzisoli]|uniref:Galactosyltransferase C-terminal domain-containing protein n=1 Tax=Niallia oryzisoli TaxID=1737571 RepID=A0ABZ2CLX4_9BACI
MLEQVSILIPFKGDNGIRSAALQWVIRFYQNVIPEAEICIGENSDSFFNRCKAINAAAEKAPRNIFVLADADVIYDSDLLIESIHSLEKAQWVIPFNRILDLSKEKTEETLKMEPFWPLVFADGNFNEYKIDKMFAGKLNVFTREAFEKAGRYDERFLGWGFDDDAFLLAMNTLCGQFVSLNRPIYLFWHPYVGADNNPHYKRNLIRLYRYQLASGNPIKMKKIIQNNRQGWTKAP